MSFSKPTRQDWKWSQIGTISNRGETPFFRVPMHLFRSPKTFASQYAANKFDSLDRVIAKLPIKSPRYIMDTVGSLDVGTALSGDPECFIRRELRKSKRLRLGINPSNEGVRADVNHYKAAAYVAVIKCARRMGFTVEAEMAYGGMSEYTLGTGTFWSDSSPWSIRVELGTMLPCHVLAAYGTNHAITETSEYQYEQDAIRRANDPNARPLMHCHYQTQDTVMRAITSKEYDICFDRLLAHDTVETMAAFLHTQLAKLSMRPEHIQSILNCVKIIR